MKTRVFQICLGLCVALNLFGAQKLFAYNFGDFRSETLLKKAWGALADEDIEAVLAFTNKVMELYGEQAQKMNDSLSDYPEGEPEDVFSYWALNDVATSLFVQAEAYRAAEMTEEARETYNVIINEYTYGQTWDDQEFFWKPAEAAKEKLAMLDNGMDLDFGDYSSAYLTNQAWKALAADDLTAVLAYTDKVMELYGKTAKEMQESLTEYAWESKDKIFSYWALNDVGTCLFVRGEAYKKAGMNEEAAEAYKKLIDEFYYAQCWDDGGWFWKPAEAAQEALDDLES